MAEDNNMAVDNNTAVDNNMAVENNTENGFEFMWIIENFDFCWHKTGEFLTSPLFWMDDETAWRLFLYPRGEMDGEYVSCYLFREEGGPEIVNVDFSLCLTAGKSGEFVVKPSVSFSKIYSFKVFQREGLACFASRKEIFAPKFAQKERFALNFECKIFRVNDQKFDQTRHHGRTTIVTQRISGTAVFDDPADHCEDLDVKPLLEKDPLIGIGVSCSRESLVIKIHPKSCHKIKYAICKIAFIHKWTNGSPIEYVRCWIGKIQAHIWRYKIPYQETESVKQSFEVMPSEALILHYDLAFPTGDEVMWNSLMDPSGCLKTPNFTLSGYLDLNVHATTCIPTALGSLFSSVESDTKVGIKMENASYSHHRVLMLARQPKYKVPSFTNVGKLLFSPAEGAEVEMKFLRLLYTDSVECRTFKEAVTLYRLAFLSKIELLQSKCRLYITDSLQFHTAISALELAVECRDSSMKAIAESYIIKHFDTAYNATTWHEFSEKHPKLARKTFLLKYIKKKTMH